MNARHVTIVILIVNLLLLVGWDFLAEARGGDRATISRVLFDAIKAYPALAVAVGALIGHLFFSQHLGN